MKNLLLTTAFALLTLGCFSQELNRSLIETLTAPLQSDSVLIFELGGAGLLNNPRLDGYLDFDKGFTFNKVASYPSDNAIHHWKQVGVYMAFCIKDGIPVGGRTVFVIYGRYVDIVAKMKTAHCFDNMVVSIAFQYIGMPYLKVIIAQKP